MKFKETTALLVLLCCTTSAANAEVVDSTDAGIMIRNVATIAAPPQEVWGRMLNFGRYWHPDHTWSGNANNLSLEERAGGCFCEKLEGGGAVKHLEVVYLHPGKMLRLRGALGPFQSFAIDGALTMELAVTEGGTLVTWTYALGGVFPGGMKSVAPVVDMVMAGHLTRLEAWIEKGDPSASAAPAP
jgi:uncharacterized protein YndB with AHSA1/START domain